MKKNIFYVTLLSFLFAGTNIFAQQPDWNRVNCETSSVFTGVVTVNGEKATTNDMVGVFINGECRMISTVIHVNDTAYVSAVIHVNADEETATIKFYNSVTDEVVDLDTNFNVKSQGSIKKFPIAIKSEEVPNKLTSAVEANIVEVYPSPFTNALQINTGKTIKNVSVHNSIGNVLKSVKDVNDSNLTLETQDYSTGLYLVSIEFTDGTVVTKKVFKK